MKYALTPVTVKEAERPELAFACLIQDTETLVGVQELLADDDILAVSVGTETGEYWPIYVRYSQPSYRTGGNWYRVTRRDSKGRFTK